MRAGGAISGSVGILWVDNKSPEFSRLRQDIGMVPDEACFPAALVKHSGLDVEIFVSRILTALTAAVSALSVALSVKVYRRRSA